MHEKIRNYAVVGTVGLLTAVLSLCSWLGKDAAFSESERRALAQKPELSAESVLSGSFMTDFEVYTADQFPQRETFRTMHSLLRLGVFRQSDTDGLYMQDGYLAQMQYPLAEAMLDHAGEKFRWLYEQYLTDSQVYFSIVPDKHYFLSQESGRLSLDYGALVEGMRERTEYMQYIDIFPYLDITDYYRTDTHWRQECIQDAAGAIAEAMGTELAAEYELRETGHPFRGVYYGQLALPVEPDGMYYLSNEMLDGCIVTSYNTGLPVQKPMYDMEKAAGRDPYELFLCGADALVTIENPEAASDRELIVFRDSFGSSLVPLLAEGYSKITVIDIRYVQPAMLGNLVEFKGQDVLFLYSTLILNNSLALK
ncbi:MAG: hypothetical protein IJY06_06910 [Oscillospiraceae bacterium]|nr:hypothetical protein [Oscillospiraceae bacterium]